MLFVDVSLFVVEFDRGWLGELFFEQALQEFDFLGGLLGVVQAVVHADAHVRDLPDALPEVEVPLAAFGPRPKDVLPVHRLSSKLLYSHIRLHERERCVVPLSEPIRRRVVKVAFPPLVHCVKNLFLKRTRIEMNCDYN